MTEPCSQIELLREMHGDIKIIATEVKAMNGNLKTTKQDFEEHKKESCGYRKKIDILWAVIHTTKWAVMVVFGSGVLFQIWDKIIR